VTNRFNKGEEDRAERQEDRQDAERSEAAQGQRFLGGINQNVDARSRQNQTMKVIVPQPTPPAASDSQAPSKWERWGRLGAFVVGLATVVGVAIALGRAVGWFG
jgi:hypothetical protein